MLVIIHHSQSKFGNAAIVTKWHLEKGFHTIGYQYVILNGQLSKLAYNEEDDGRIETGRPLDDDNIIEYFEYGAHVRGKNAESIGICLVGLSGEFTKKQIDSLKVLLKRLKTQFGFIEIKQHSDYDPSKPYCAGLNLNQMCELFEI